MARAPRRLVLAALAALSGAAAVLGFTSDSSHSQQPAYMDSQSTARKLVEQGRELYEEGCVSCHGFEARGINGVAPSLQGVGAGAADFYLSTGRMPLNNPKDQPIRSDPRYSPSEIDALVAYVGSLGGPPVPDVHPRGASLNRGLEAFSSHCAGCHQVVARGGIVTGAFAPPLLDATPTQVAEAVRLGPYLMPRFSKREIDDRSLDEIAAYVQYAKDPVNEGGWALGNIGPVPEGMVAWLLAIVALLALARLLGERTGDPR